MTEAEQSERLRLTFQRRIRAIALKYNMLPLSRARMLYLTTRLARTKGDYVTDQDLRTLIRLVHRGFID